MNKLFTYGTALALGLGMASGLSAQHRCGTSHQDQLELKQRMMEQRRDEAQIFQEYMLRRTSNTDTVYYVPIQFHITGDQAGEGYVPVDRVLGTLCRLNDDYRNQNIQFYIYGIQTINNNYIYNHGTNSGDGMATYFMALYKVPNVVNVFIGRNVTNNDEFLAYYTRNIDVIYSFKTGIGAGNPTLTHEMGHYFTLPHTFFGWEGTDYPTQEVNGKAPEQVGGMNVERMVRTGGRENCQIAADGFCDTPSDYYSDRIVCPFPYTYYDPDSVVVVPDPNNFMSYFNDNCVNTFSNEQKQAIIRDFLARGYDRFPTPSPLVVTEAPTLVWPNSGEPALYPSAVNFRWNAAAGADRYLVTIERTVGGVSVGTEAEFIAHDNQVTMSLTANRTYRWKVKAINSVDVCNSFESAFTSFSTLDFALATENLQNISGSKLYPNPMSRNEQSILEIQASQAGQASLRIFNALGQTVMPSQTLELQAGNNSQMLDLSSLQAGLYLIQVDGQKGERYTHRLVIQD